VRIDGVECGRDLLGGGDHRRHDGDVPGLPGEVVAVRCVVAVIAPDAADRGRAADPGRVEALDDGPVHGVTVMARGLGGVDRQSELRRHARPDAGLAPGGLRSAHELPVPLAQPDLLDRHQRAAEHRAELGKQHRDPVPGTDRDHHEGNVGVAAEELAVLRAGVPGVVAVDAGQHGGAGDPPAVQQLAGRFEGRHLVGPIPLTAVHGQPGGIPGLLAEPDRLYLARQKACSLDRDQPRPGQPHRLVEHRLDVGAGIDRDRGQRRLRRLRERSANPRLRPPGPLDAGEQDAGRGPPPSVEANQSLA
jgi:hypothetical protein